MAGIGVFVFVMFGAFFVLVVVLVVVSARRARERRESLAAYAVGRGWTYSERDDSLANRFRDSPFGLGHSRRASNVIRGTYDSRPMVAFDYQYATTETSTDAEGHTTTREVTHSYSVVTVHIGAALPALSVTPERMLSRFLGRLMDSDIELESEEFNRAFRVTCPSRRFASDVLHPRMMQMLLQWPELAWRFDRDSMVAVRAGAHGTDEIDAKLAALDAVLDTIPDFVWQEVRGQ